MQKRLITTKDGPFLDPGSTPTVLALPFVPPSWAAVMTGGYCHHRYPRQLHANHPPSRKETRRANRANRRKTPRSCAGPHHGPDRRPRSGFFHSSPSYSYTLLAGGRDPPVCWCPPRCGAPLRPPRGVVCPPVVGACPVCCPPLQWVLAPCAGAPLRCCGPNRDHCYDRREATALDASIHSLHGDTRGAATHTPTGRVSGGLGRCTPSSTARSRRSVSRAVVQQPVAVAATAPLPTW